jgi:hypothetical protein
LIVVITKNPLSAEGYKPYRAPASPVFSIQSESGNSTSFVFLASQLMAGFTIGASPFVAVTARTLADHLVIVNTETSFIF